MTHHLAYFELLHLLSSNFSATGNWYYYTSAIAFTKGMLTAYPADDVLKFISSSLVTWRSIRIGTGHDAAFADLAGQAGNVRERFHHPHYRWDEVQDLHEFMQALAATDPNDPERGPMFHQLAVTFIERHKKFLLLDDLENAILAGEQAVVTPSEHPHWIVAAGNLGYCYLVRFHWLGGLDDLEKAIRKNEQVVAATPLDDPALGVRLCNLSTAFYSRFVRFDDEADIQMALSASEQAVAVHTDRAAALTTHSVMLNARFLWFGHGVDADNAVQASLKAIDASLPDDPHLPAILNTLGNTCRSRFEKFGDLEDLSMAVSASRMASDATPVKHPDRATCLNDLSISLWTRFERLGHADDLDSAIVAIEESVAITPVIHPNRAHMLVHLGQCLNTRCARFGDMTDLDRAVQAGAEGIAATPQDHPHRAGRLASLGHSFSIRFERFGAVDDLHRAIQANSEALALLPLDHPDRPVVLANLGEMLHSRFSRLGDSADLETAIQASEEAIEATPRGVPHHAIMLDKLGHQFHRRFELGGLFDDLAAAIRSIEDAVQIIPEDHPSRAAMLNSLGWWSYKRYERFEDMRDLEKALQASEAAVIAIHPDDQDRANTELLLGYLLQSSGDCKRALTVGIGAWQCSRGRPSVRIRAASFAASLLAMAGCWREASLLMEEAVRMLPSVSPRFLSRHDHQHMLAEFAELTSLGIAAALEVQSSPAKCLSLLEVGRGIMIGLTIDCRSDLSELQAIDPDLFDRLSSLRTTIDSSLGSVGWYGEVYQPEDENRRRQRVRAIDEMEETLAAIRQVPGLEEFQLPPSTERLLAVAAEGPIVVFNSTLLRSDAIILTSSSIKALPLPKMRFSDVTDRMNELPGLSRGKRSTYPSRNRKMQRSLLWLWEVAVEPVLEELNFQAVDESELPRIWWIGVGQLATAPFHAAGDHSRESTRNTLSRAVSSYTPTLKALSYARQKKLDLGPDSRLLLVTMATTSDTPAILAVPGRPGIAAIPGTAAVPATLTSPFVARTHGTAAVYRTLAIPGVNAKTWKPLPNAMTEVEDIMQEVHGTVDRLDSPSVANVLERLPQFNIAHFACHGVSDRHNPSNSHLLLHPDDSSCSGPGKLTVGAISAIHMDVAQIAYLSACCSADNAAVQLVDEGIHIASGFQLAGFSHVLATLWESNDAACRQVAREFYRGLFGSGAGGGEHRVVSAAFQHAVRKLRDENVEQPIRWASFIHSGA